MLQWVERSEKRLLAAHESMALKLKQFKRIFISKGTMMKTFDHINRLHDSGNYKGIRRVVEMLYRDMPPHWSCRYHKYEGLIRYCEFLESSQRANLLEELRASLNMGHELGRGIYGRAVELVCQ